MGKNITLGFLLLWLAFHAGPVRAQAPSGASLAPPSGLAEFVRAAVDRSPTVDSARKEAEATELEYDSSARFYFPKLSLNSTVGQRRGSPPYTDEPSVSALNADLTSTLLAPGVMDGWERARFRKERAKLLFTRARDAVALEVANRWLALVEAQRRVQQETELQATFERQAGIVQGQYRQGTRARRDHLRFQTQVRRSQIRSAAAREAFEKAQTALAEMLPGVGRLSQVMEPVTPLAIPALRILLDGAFEKRQVELNQKIRKLETNIADPSHWPDLSLIARGRYETSGFMTDQPGLTQSEQREAGIFLSLSWTLFDGGATGRGIRILEARRQIGDNDDEVLLRSTQRRFEELKIRVQRNEENRRLANELLQMEEGSFRDLQSDFREGRSSYLDLVTGLDDLASARREQLSAATEAKRLYYETLYEEGRLYESF